MTDTTRLAALLGEALHAVEDPHLDGVSLKQERTAEDIAARLIAAGVRFDDEGLRERIEGLTQADVADLSGGTFYWVYRAGWNAALRAALEGANDAG